MQDSLIFYRSFYNAINGVADKKTRAELYDIICAYGLDGIIPEKPSEIANAVFELIRPQIDANIQRRENGYKGAEHGIKGGRPSKNPIGVMSEKPIGENSKTPNDNVNDNGNENYNDNAYVNKNDNGNITVKGEGVETPTRKAYGTYKNVLLSDDEIEAIKIHFPNIWEYGINRLSEYMTNGKQYRNHYAKVMEFLKEDTKKYEQQKKEAEIQELEKRKLEEMRKHEIPEEMPFT